MLTLRVNIRDYYIIWKKGFNARNLSLFKRLFPKYKLKN